eukprot:CAMPEP_0175056994 /NCGR_PEP_ID=MMETSP0052_2-20121109/11004_1 /TAXON_ID=51329 ORGANISM="Polytomella parva, Strain SAG 63-3" /NCGR_SAMPLE_ID=MMETSP0052_2 /ASSEMBLY_ACC=CAM_ASM_000194 /LENGTH=479 /DNA_ID=CAMNT_0016322131 /DNA_START=198 /DNA_END=1634 /DNA_ORIENTATION=-
MELYLSLDSTASAVEEMMVSTANSDEATVEAFPSVISPSFPGVSSVETATPSSDNPVVSSPLSPLIHPIITPSLPPNLAPSSDAGASSIETSNFESPVLLDNSPVPSPPNFPTVVVSDSRSFSAPYALHSTTSPHPVSSSSPSSSLDYPPLVLAPSMTTAYLVTKSTPGTPSSPTTLSNPTIPSNPTPPSNPITPIAPLITTAPIPTAVAPPSITATNSNPPLPLPFPPPLVPPSDVAVEASVVAPGSEIYQIDPFSASPGAYSQREEALATKEERGELSFVYCHNDPAAGDNSGSNNALHMTYLIGLKNIFSRQLPNMPREYIVRLVMDRRHRSVALIKKDGSKEEGHVMGGITYRAFHSQALGEIAFCAITSVEQVKGFGTRLMNYTKEYARSMDGIRYFLTYADNNAVGYFEKQGFSKEITYPRELWREYIKDYDGGTLMGCYLHPHLGYIGFAEMIRMQRRALDRRVREMSNSHT